MKPKRTRTPLIWTTFTAAFAFGVGFNALVTWLNRRGHSEGYTALLVVTGTLATILACTPHLGWRTTAVLIAHFAASGSPMVLGDIQRYVESRQRMEELHGQ